jgi:hypothetical protein
MRPWNNRGRGCAWKMPNGPGKVGSSPVPLRRVDRLMTLKTPLPLAGPSRRIFPVAGHLSATPATRKQVQCGSGLGMIGPGDTI